MVENLQNSEGKQFSRRWQSRPMLRIVASLLAWVMCGHEAWGQNIPTEAAPAATAARFSLCTGGQVQVWGDNSAGQLGLGTTGGTVAQPTTNPYLTNVVAMASGNQHTVALLANGKVYAWGSNSVGQLGLGTTGAAIGKPQLVPLTCVVALSANGNYTMALKADGTLWSWGNNSYGQLGYGTGGASNVPRRVAISSPVAQVSAGPSHCLALLTNGTVLGWGANGYYLFGPPTVYYQYTPTPINLPAGGISTITRLASSYGNSALVTTTGQIYTWGDNSYGQIGNGTVGGGIYNTPVAVTLPANTLVTDVTTSQNSVCAITSTGQLLTWGSNYHGELGDPRCATAGTGTVQNIPAPGPPLSGVVAIQGLIDGFLATLNNGQVRTWGSATASQLGYPTTPTGASYSCTATSPVGLCPAKPATQPTLPNVAVSASTTTTCAGLPVGLTATGGDGSNYTWSPATGLSATTGSQVIATPKVTTTYTVSSGCGNSASVTLTVETNCCPIDVYTSLGTRITDIAAGTYTASPFTRGAGAIYHVLGDIHLTQDSYTVGVGAQVLLDRNAHIFVEDQAELISNGATFTAACRDTWGDIEISDLANTPLPRGIAFTSAFNSKRQLVRSRIEHASGGIVYWLFNPYSPQQNPPYLLVEDTDFSNLLFYGAYVLASNTPMETLKMYIRRCSFDCDPTALKSGFGSSYAYNYWYTPRHLFVSGDLRNAELTDNTFSHSLVSIEAIARPWLHVTNSTFNEFYLAGIVGNFRAGSEDRPKAWTNTNGDLLDYELRLENNVFNFPFQAQLNTSQANNERRQHNQILSPSYTQVTGVFMDQHDVQAWDNTFQQLHADSVVWNKYVKIPHLGLYGNRVTYLERNRFKLLGTGVQTNPSDAAYVPALYDNAFVNCRISHDVGEAAYPQTGTSVATSCNSFIRNEPITPRGGETYGIYVEPGMQVRLANPTSPFLGTIKNLFDYRTPVSGAYLYVYNDSGNPLDYRTFTEYVGDVAQHSSQSPGSTLNVVTSNENFDYVSLSNNCAADLFGNGIQQLRTAGKKPGQQPTARLEQNSPNPTTGETTIRYEVAAGTRQAELLLREGWNAKEVLRLSVDVTQQQVQLQTARLPEGMYFYTLLVDGVPVQTKRMVVTH